MNFKLYFLLLIFIPFTCYAKLSVVTTTTDIQWLVEKIGGTKVSVESLLNGSEDPHFIDAMPHFIGKVASADVFCLVGMDLEVGWAPKILAKSGNKDVQPGGKGYCETGRTVKALNIPKGRIDRSMGDIHPQGNPHYHLGPAAFLMGGETVLNTLIAVDSKNTEYYLKQFDKMSNELKAIKKEVALLLRPLKDKYFMEYHRELTYYLKEYGLNNMGAVEKVPGVPPSAGRLARVSIQAKNQKIYAVLATMTSPIKILNRFNEISKVPVVRIPLSISKNAKPKTYKDLQIYIAKKLLEVSNK